MGKYTGRSLIVYTNFQKWKKFPKCCKKFQKRGKQVILKRVIALSVFNFHIVFMHAVLGLSIFNNVLAGLCLTWFWISSCHYFNLIVLQNDLVFFHFILIYVFVFDISNSHIFCTCIYTCIIVNKLIWVHILSGKRSCLYLA